MFHVEGKPVKLGAELENLHISLFGQSVEQSKKALKANPRASGNMTYALKNYPAALSAYNIALLESHDNDVEKSLCYANRAACYLEMKFFKNCLHNLDLAEPHYPAEKMKKLHERREKCLKLMAVERDEGQIKLEHPFDKLTYPANPKLPFFIDAIELKQDKVFGRHLVTSQDLKAGDVIALIDRSLMYRGSEVHICQCAYCLKYNNNDLAASEKCEKALFCSQSCLKAYIKIDHKLLSSLEMKSNGACQQFNMTVKVFMQILNSFDSIADMRQFVEGNEKDPKTVFDFDWTDPDDSDSLKNILCCILSTESNESNCKNEFVGRTKCFIAWITGDFSPNCEFSRFFKENDREHGYFIERVLWKIFKALDTWNPLRILVFGVECYAGCFFHPCMLLLNHSCDPNIFTTVVNENKVTWIANRPIKAGQQIFVNYMPEFYSSKSLQEKCNYSNSCVPCQREWKKALDPRIIAEDERWMLIMTAYDKNEMFRKEILKEIKAGFKFINSKFEGYENNARQRDEIVKKLQELKRQCRVLFNPPFGNTQLKYVKMN